MRAIFSMAGKLSGFSYQVAVKSERSACYNNLVPQSHFFSLLYRTIPNTSMSAKQNEKTGSQAGSITDAKGN